MSLGRGRPSYGIISDAGTPSVRYAFYLSPDRFAQLLTLLPFLILLSYLMFPSLKRSRKYWFIAKLVERRKQQISIFIFNSPTETKKCFSFETNVKFSHGP